ncbi:hypothetical protein ANO14919_082060 [Xylariales sp. No.14919]|nr:hypothetical protein ANO14919_082060 [Xylariales sp. No.14919]
MASQSGDNSQYPVYLGIWTNWSRGQVLGCTLTLERREANLLIALTAFFVAFVSTRFWRIVCFAFHRHYATSDKRDVVYHQRQAILRNSYSAESGVQLLLQLIWTTRSSRSRFYLILLVLVASICIAAFTVAGGLSSQISTAVGTEVLINSQNCGCLDGRKLGNVSGQADLGLVLDGDVAEKVDAAATYAQQCYANSTAGTLDCGRYNSRALKSIIQNDAPCPFKEELCRSSSANLRIDSGFIDSHEDLGLNARIEDRILIRYVLHCAPINTQNYTSQINTSIGTLTAYHYGTSMAPLGPVDYVWSAESVQAQYASAFALDATGPLSHYQLSTLFAIVRDEQVDTRTSNFRPIEPMLRKDADINISFLSSNGVIYSLASDDQWYRVSPSPVDFPMANANESDTIPVYLPLEPASPLGCIQHYQFCHGDTQHCGPLASLLDAIGGAASFFNSTANDSKIIDGGTPGAGLFQYVLSVFRDIEYPALYAIPDTLGAASLTSRKNLFDSVQGQLDSNQWQMDVTYWWNIYMASLQQSFLNVAYVSPQASSVLRLRSSFPSAFARNLCNNQKIRSTAHASFSVFGLLFTFMIGFLITLTSYILEPVSGLLYRRWGFKSYAHLEWASQTTLQLQRLAHEELGSGTWSNGTKEIPTTEVGDLLVSLDISDPDHPVLRLPHKDDHSLADSQTIQGGSEEYSRADQYHANESPNPERFRSEIQFSAASGGPQLPYRGLALTSSGYQWVDTMSSSRRVCDEIYSDGIYTYNPQEYDDLEVGALLEAPVHSTRESQVAERASN